MRCNHARGKPRFTQTIPRPIRRIRSSHADRIDRRRKGIMRHCRVILTQRSITSKKNMLLPILRVRLHSFISGGECAISTAKKAPSLAAHVCFGKVVYASAARAEAPRNSTRVCDSMRRCEWRIVAVSRYGPVQSGGTAALIFAAMAAQSQVGMPKTHHRQCKKHDCATQIL